MIYLRRFISQIADMRMNVALSDPDTTSKTLKRAKFKTVKLVTLDWNVNYSQLNKK